MNIKRRPSDEIVYPESDGKPMAETDVHRDWMVCVIQWLKAFFVGQWCTFRGICFFITWRATPSAAFHRTCLSSAIVIRGSAGPTSSGKRGKDQTSRSK